MPRPRRKPDTRTIRFLHNVGGRWTGEIADYDTGSARWLVNRGYAEYVTDSHTSPQQ